MDLKFKKEISGKFSKFAALQPWSATLLGILMASTAWGQARSPEPLTIEALYAAANLTHPLLLAARMEARVGKTDVNAVERQRWPTLSALVESNTGNTTSLPANWQLSRYWAASQASSDVHAIVNMQAGYASGTLNERHARNYFS